MIKTSRTPLRSAVAKLVRDRSAITSSMMGNRCLKSSKDVRRLPTESEVQNPILRRPASLFRTVLAVAIIASNSSRIVLAMRRTPRPVCVGPTPQLKRSKIAMPK